MNKENLLQVIAKIKSDPGCWLQTQWHCGTQHCIAGHAQIMGGNTASDTYTRRDARIFFDISRTDADWLFASDRTIADFEAFVDDDGFDRAGFDRAGFDRAGFDRDGFDRDGFDRDGFDRDGLDINNKPRP